MALKQCPECKREISQRARRCPHCGFKDLPANKVFWTFLILYFVAVAAVAIMVVVHTQKVNRAKANLDESIRRADAGTVAYSLIYSSPTRRLAVKATPSPVSQPDQQSKLAETSAAGAKPPFVTLRQDVLVQLPYDTVTLRAGTRLEFVSSDSSEVHVRYNGAEYVIPLSATDLR
jgi:uncharacterized protein UPF0547